MCNAWNHSPNCRCDFRGGQRGISRSTLQFSSSRPAHHKHLLGNIHALSKAGTEGAKTYPTHCRYCNASVYYHTNGYGDSVLFDYLGEPWQVHPCWEENRSEAKGQNSSPLKLPKAEPIILGKSLLSSNLKYLVILGAVMALRKDKKSVAKDSVAQQLGLTLEELSHTYGEFSEFYKKDKITWRLYSN